MALDIVLLGQRVAAARRKRGLSQYALAELICKTGTYMCYIEGGTKCMSLDTFVDLANALNATADSLLQDSLDNTMLVIHSSFSELLSDCTTYEQRVLLEIVAAAKEAMRSNKSPYINWHR